MIDLYEGFAFEGIELEHVLALVESAKSLIEQQPEEFDVHRADSDFVGIRRLKFAVKKLCFLVESWDLGRFFCPRGIRSNSESHLRPN